MKPIVKWPGGKRQLLDRIIPLIPERFGTYIEPFVGGGAVFFALAAERRFLHGALIGDINEDLVVMYQAIRAAPHEVSEALRRHEALHGLLYYHGVRANRPLDPVGRAAWMLYINRAGFNGLYRVNKRGICNVPWGKREHVRLPTIEALLATADALRVAEVEVWNFESACAMAEPGDLVYCDPPYLKPDDGSGGFVGYAADGFGPADHERLARAFWSLVDRGVHVVLHNADCELARDLYDGATIEVVQGRRAINRNGAGRGGVPELLITEPR